MYKYRIYCEIICNGFVPIKYNDNLKKYQNSGFTLIENEFNDEILKNIPMLYSINFLQLSTYCYKNDNINRYLSFIKEDYLILECENKIENMQKDFDYFNSVTKNIEKDAYNLIKKLRIINNDRITYPLIIFKLYELNSEKYIGQNIILNGYPKPLRKNNYDKQLLNLRRDFNLNELNKLEDNNKQFKNALYFYTKSFEIDDIDSSYMLLFSSLESLFNYNNIKHGSKKILNMYGNYEISISEEEGCSIINSISIIADKIHFNYYDSKYVFNKIRELYKKRCNFTHGKETSKILIEKYNYLNDIVRDILYYYWIISLFTNNYNHSKIIDYILKTEVPLFTIQASIIYSKSFDYNMNLKYCKNKLRESIIKDGNENPDILSMFQKEKMTK